MRVFRRIALVLLFPVLVGAQTPVQCRAGHEKLEAALWAQVSVERKAAVLGIYRSAQRQLALMLSRSKGRPARNAIIMDVDETVLDNAPYFARLIASGGGNWDNTLWTEWVKEAAATAVPGAVEFTKYAASRGVTVFFITNREQFMEGSTRENLKRAGFPLPSDLDTVLTKGERAEWGSDKAGRRKFVMERFRVLLMFGDDLNDFTNVNRQSTTERVQTAATVDANWGTRWFMIPNPLYGTWEEALYGFYRQESQSRILELKLKALGHGR